MVDQLNLQPGPRPEACSESMFRLYTALIEGALHDALSGHVKNREKQLAIEWMEGAHASVTFEQACDAVGLSVSATQGFLWDTLITKKKVHIEGEYCIVD